ncbi:MAG: thermonuclease family protein [Candidatus Saccharimonadales bacterium]|nr:thermonuclease family protein [Candidatus Saccharimonadales bacterium]
MKSKIRQAISNSPALKNLLISLLAMLLGVVGLETLAPDVFSRIENVLGEIQPGYYQVIEVNDGDTITVKANGRNERVRLIGIDTPEKNHPDKPVQCFAETASRRLAELIDGQGVMLEADPVSTNRDRYDRLLRYVYSAEGLMLNRAMVADGYAFAYLNFPHTYLDEFEKLEENAKQKNLGLWSACRVELENGFISTESL